MAFVTRGSQSVLTYEFFSAASTSTASTASPASTTSRLRGRVGRRERRGASPNSTPAKGLTQTLRLNRDVEDCSLAAFGDDARAGARSRGRAHSLLRELLCAAAEERTRGCAAFRNHSDSIGEGRSVTLALTKEVSRWCRLTGLAW